MTDQDTTDQQRTLARFDASHASEREAEQQWQEMMREDNDGIPNTGCVALALIMCLATLAGFAYLLHTL